MDSEELKEIYKQLEAQGWNPMVCDSTVPLSGLSAVCGLPSELGDEYIEDYILFPKSLVGSQPEMFVTVSGYSMMDGGYEPGDILRIRFGVSAYDGDDVVALIDGRCTVKTLFTDEEGTKWLVPRNEDFDAIEITPDMDARILGVVMSVEKAARAASTSYIQKAVRRTKNKNKATRKLQPEDIEECIKEIGKDISLGRQWYAVYRTLLDAKLFADDSIGDFCNRVKTLLPEHEHLPEVKEVQRMAVDSFARPVALWNENDAPVSGKRYDDYLRIARKMMNLLSEK